MFYSLIFFTLGEKALNQLLEDAQKVADRCVHAEDRDLILRCSGDIQTMANSLAELRQQGKVIIFIFS